MQTLFIPNENSMLSVGAQLAAICQKKSVIFLYGELGAGKTTLVRGFLRGLGFSERVKSPTYTLVETYALPQCTIVHFDLYRIHHPNELQFVGIEEYFSPDNIVLIEWPEKGAGWLPPADLSCYIEPHSEGRMMRVEAATEQGKMMLQQWQINQ